MVQPMQFIPFAEQTGFVRFLTLWMLEAAACEWKNLQPAQGSLRIAINLSTRDLMDLDFPRKIDALLDEADAQVLRAQRGEHAPADARSSRSAVKWAVAGATARRRARGVAHRLGQHVRH